MQVFIVYAHPSEDSFTKNVLDEFVRGLENKGHNYTISDLYKMNFRSDISEAEYLREANYREDLPLETDVIAEQDKINLSDMIVFIYPVFWSEAPSKLVGWFDRVWTYGFAYGKKTMKVLHKALVLCITGRTVEHLKEHGQYESMKNIMLDDRLYDRVTEKEMIFLDGTTRFYPELRKNNWNKHLKKVYEIACSL